MTDWTRLWTAGAVTLGKLRSELALGPFGDNAHHGGVQNPWRFGHARGGRVGRAWEQLLGGFTRPPLP